MFVAVMPEMPTPRPMKIWSTMLYRKFTISVSAVGTE